MISFCVQPEVAFSIVGLLSLPDDRKLIDRLIEWSISLSSLFRSFRVGASEFSWLVVQKSSFGEISDVFRSCMRPSIPGGWGFLCLACCVTKTAVHLRCSSVGFFGEVPQLSSKILISREYSEYPRCFQRSLFLTNITVSSAWHSSRATPLG